MKLVRFGEKGRERPGVWMEDGRILDVRALAFHIEDYNEHFFTHYGLKQLAALVKDSGATFVDGSTVRLGAPIARPSKIVCVGANYAAHAKEFGGEIPSEPILFSKATSAINGPFDPIVLPAGASMVDAEVELAVVIGKTAANVREVDALDFVAGYMVMNDVTDREAQKNDGQWFRGKGCQSFCPMGPFLVTHDELSELSELDDVRVWQDFNGVCLQDATPREMLFSIPFLIEYISRNMTLLPGDVISTGTPPGIGSARDPALCMQRGDQIELGVAGLGRQIATVETVN